MNKILLGALVLAMFSLPCAAQSPPTPEQRAAYLLAEQERAMASIDRFTRDMGAADPRYFEIEKKIIPLIPDVINNYPPQYWLSIIKLLYQVRAIP